VSELQKATISLSAIEIYNFNFNLSHIKTVITDSNQSLNFFQHYSGIAGIVVCALRF
jgi:hypothetical protein